MRLCFSGEGGWGVVAVRIGVNRGTRVPSGLFLGFSGWDRLSASSHSALWGPVSIEVLGMPRAPLIKRAAVSSLSDVFIFNPSPWQHFLYPQRTPFSIMTLLDVDLPLICIWEFFFKPLSLNKMQCEVFLKYLISECSGNDTISLPKNADPQVC